MLHPSYHLTILKKEIVFDFVSWISFIARDRLLVFLHFVVGLYEKGFWDEEQQGVQISTRSDISRVCYNL